MPHLALYSSQIDDAAHFVLHVLLAPADPEHLAHGQGMQMDRIHMGLVKHDNLAGRNVDADGGFMRVVVPCRLDKDETRQEGAQVKAQMHFRGGLPATVLRPVHAIGDQLDG